MIIKRDANATIKPRAFEELLKRQHIKYYNAQWELRKPIGVYNVALANIWDSFREVLDELDKVLEERTFREMPPTKRWDKNLVRRQEDLIHHIMRYFDDCFNMLCCFYPRTNLSMDIKALQKDQDQIKKRPEIMKAWNDIAEYRNHIASITNHIKHHQGTLRGIVMFNDNYCVPGYFVEHMNQDEALAPHPEVHKQIKGQATAFSFFRDLRYKLWIVYAVGERLADAICKIESSVSSNTNAVGKETEIVDIVKRIASLPTRVFDDETNLDFPNIQISSENDFCQLNMEYPSKNVILIPLLKPAYVSTGWVSDGTTEHFVLPYFSGIEDEPKSYDV